MGNHPFNVIVFLFWLATMSWLVVAKVLPPLRVGEPPSYGTIVRETIDSPPVCWTVRWHDRPIGWAASKAVRRKDGISDQFSRVYLGDFPWQEIAPGWMASVLQPVLSNLNLMDIDKKSTVVIDPLGRLVRFDSRVRIGSLTDAIKLQGQIEGPTLRLSVTSGDVPYKLERFLPPNALMTDELSPQSFMPGLRVGQNWTVPLYSPFHSPQSPLEILQASVEREDKITYEGQSVPCRVIVYRGDSGSGMSGSETRGRVWVRTDGVVLRQEVTIMNSLVAFDRLGETQAESIWGALGEDWTGNLSPELARQLLDQLTATVPHEE